MLTEKQFGPLPDIYSDILCDSLSHNLSSICPVIKLSDLYLASHLRNIHHSIWHFLKDMHYAFLSDTSHLIQIATFYHAYILTFLGSI